MHGPVLCIFASDPPFRENSEYCIYGFHVFPALGAVDVYYTEAENSAPGNPFSVPYGNGLPAGSDF